MSYTGPHPQLNPVVLSDTLNEWREKTNKHVDILNFSKVYDIVHGDGITYSRIGGDIELEIAPYISKGITIGGDLTVEGNIQFTGTAARFDVSIVSIEDHQIELGVCGAADQTGPATDDAGIDDGGIMVLSTDSPDKKWTFKNSFAGHQTWTSNQHIGISAGKAFVPEDRIIRFESDQFKGLQFEFTSDVMGAPVADVSFTPSSGSTATMFGNGTGTGGIRIREDGYVEIFNGVNRKFVSQIQHGFVHGDVLRFDGENYILAQANTERTAEAMGIVDRSSYADTDNFIIVTHGEVQGFSGGALNDEGVELVSGEIYFLSVDNAGKTTYIRPTNKRNIVKPMFLATSPSTAYVLNYIGGIVPDQDIIANSLPQVWQFTGDGATGIFGLSGSASDHSGTYIVSIDGVIQTPQNDAVAGATYGTGNDILFGNTAGVTGNASFRILTGPGSFSFGNGNRIEFIQPPPSDSVVAIVNQSLTTPYVNLEETYVRTTGTTESRKLLDKLADKVSVLDYGAVGDGVIDDTAAIQSALDQTEHRRIFFPSGTYITTLPLQITQRGQHLLGDSMEDAIIEFKGTTGPIIKGPDSGYIWANKFESLHVKMGSTGGASAGIGVDCTNMHHVTFDNFQLRHNSSYVGITGSVGLLFSEFHTHRYVDSIVVGGWNKAIVINAPDPASAGYITTNVLIENCQINAAESSTPELQGPETIGISIEGGTTGCTCISARHNKIWNCDYGISVEGQNREVFLSQNSFGGASNQAIHGITADGQTNSLVLIGNTGSRAGNTGAAFSDSDKWQNRVNIEGGSVSSVNLPKVNVRFVGRESVGICDILGGTAGTPGGCTGSAYNITKVTRGGTGTYVLTFDKLLQTQHYCIQGTVGGLTAGFVSAGPDATQVSLNSCTVYCYNHEGTGFDPPFVSVTVI